MRDCNNLGWCLTPGECSRHGSKGRDGTYKKATDTIITIPVSPDLHRKIRIRAAELGITIKELGTRALEEAVRPLST